MAKSATDVMQEIVVSAVLDSFAALKNASGGLANVAARDLAAIHANTAVADLPAEVRKAIDESVRSAFSRLQREGYAVSPSSGAPSMPPRNGPPRPRPGGAGGAPVVENRRRPGGRPPAPGGGPRGPKPRG